MLKRLVKKIFNKLGLELKFAKNIPFGIEWYRDIQFFPNGRNLEIIVDVGANIGQTARQVVDIFPKSHIYCFEPIPSTFQELLLHTRPFAQITAINAALGDQITKAPMTAKPLAQRNTLVFTQDELESNKWETTLVDVNTLDNFCDYNKIHRINLLKIDTEGYEMKVLQGAEQLLSSNCIDYILIECDFFPRKNDPHGDFFEITNYLQTFNYHIVAFYNGGVNNFGWVWGDVLFRKVNSNNPGYVSRCPGRTHGISETLAS